MTITGDNLTNLGVALITFVIAPLSLRCLKEYKDLKHKERCKCEDAITLVAKLEFDFKLMTSHYDDLESVVKRVCAEFHKSGVITRHEIEALEGELAQRPKVGNNG